MRIVRNLESLSEEAATAEAEAASAFGDGTVFIEPYVEHGRHIEVQVVGDSHGGVLVLGERDCSLQRRHQKVIEESPAPRISDAMRATLHDAARDAAKAIAYVGAGTVEFMVGGDRAFFLEMNTRLQVEHPVTEAVFGIDLVEAQIAVAEGAGIDTLRAPSSATGPVGHAVEVRLYAADPGRRLPATERTARGVRDPGRRRRVRAATRARPATGLRVRGGQRGRNALRRDAREGGLVGAHT